MAHTNNRFFGKLQDKIGFILSSSNLGLPKSYPKEKEIIGNYFKNLSIDKLWQQAIEEQLDKLSEFDRIECVYVHKSIYVENKSYSRIIIDFKHKLLTEWKIKRVQNDFTLNCLLRYQELRIEELENANS